LEPFDALSLCAEVTIAILGFSGIVVVFGGYSDDSARQGLFFTLFRGTLIPLGIIAIGSVLDAAALDRGLIWRICSALHAVALCAILGVSGLSVMRQGRNPSSGQRVTMIGAFVILGLSIWNAASHQSFWPVLTTVWWSIAVSLYAFVGLIFSRETAQRNAKAGST
jgi:hypothetical protein